MRKIINFFAVICFAAVLFSGSVLANTTRKVRVEIPFDFTVGSRTFQPGTYSIEIAKDSSGGATITIVDRDLVRIQTVSARVNGKRNASGPSLVFGNIGGKRYLSEIVSVDYGILLPVSSGRKGITANLDLERVEIPIALTN